MHRLLTGAWQSAVMDASASTIATIGGGSAVATASLLDGRLDAVTVIALFMVMVGLNEMSVRRALRTHRDDERKDTEKLLVEAKAGFSREAAGLHATWERFMAQAEGHVAAVEGHTAEARKFRERVSARVDDLAREVERLKEKVQQTRPL